jgi:hypothetical protein
MHSACSKYPFFHESSAFFICDCCMRCGSDSGSRRVVFREDPEVLACAPRWARATDDFGPRGISTKPARTKGFVGDWNAAFIMISRILFAFQDQPCMQKCLGRDARRSERVLGADNIFMQRFDQLL